MMVASRFYFDSVIALGLNDEVRMAAGGWRGWKIIDKTILDLKCSSSRKKIINGTKYVHVFPPIFEKRKTET